MNGKEDSKIKNCTWSEFARTGALSTVVLTISLLLDDTQTRLATNTQKSIVRIVRATVSTRRFCGFASARFNVALGRSKRSNTACKGLVFRIVAIYFAFMRFRHITLYKHRMLLRYKYSSASRGGQEDAICDRYSKPRCTTLSLFLRNKFSF